MAPNADQLKPAAAAAVAAAVGVKMLEAGIINAECLEVKLACNLGVPSLGIPEAGSRIVKLPCLLKAVEDFSLTMTDPEMVNCENPGLTEEPGCFLGLRRTSGVALIVSTFLLGVFGMS